MTPQREMRAAQDRLWSTLPEHVQRKLKRNRKLNARKSKRRRWRDARKGTITRWP